MEKLYARATRFVAAPTARHGSGASMEKTEEAKAGVQCAGYAHVGQVWHGKSTCGTESSWEEQMISDANRLVRPGTVAQRSAVKTATREYCQAAR